jgi:pentatricopeptide repeat protein
MQKESRQARPTKSDLSSEARRAKVEGRSRESIFDIAIEMLYIALVFLAPVIFDRRVGIVFSLTKVTTIRLIIIAILTIWAVKIMLKQEHRFIRSPLDYPVLSYMLACTIATLTSVHTFTSFMGFYGRYEGLTTLYMYCLLFFITVNFIHSKEQILRVMYTVIIAGVCMSIYGVIQRMGLDPYAWGGVITWQRVIGTIGQPNFLAAYVDMAFIIGLALLLNMGDIKRLVWFEWHILYDWAIRWALILSMFLIYICILYTQSRGGFMGLFAGVFLFFTLANRDLTIGKWRELSVLFMLVVIVTAITSLNPDFSPFGRAAYEVSRMGEELGKRETPIMQYSAALSRFETWKSGYRIIADKPFFGIGQEVLKMVFPRYETNKFRFYEGFHVKQDRCHNEVCDMAVTRGIITLSIYVWMLATFFYIGVKLVRSDYDAELKLFAASFLGASAAYLIQNQFSFGVVAITTLLWIMMGMTASIFVRAEQPEPDKNVDLSNVPWLLFAITIIVAMFFAYLSTIQFRADMHFKLGKTWADTRRFDTAVKEYETSIKISPYEGGTWTHYGIAVLNLAQLAQDGRYINRSVGILNTANKVDPYNADNFYITGRAYYILSMNDIKYLDKIIDAEQKAIQIDPLYAEAYQIIGSVYEKRGKNIEAAQMYERAVEINPQLSDVVASLSNIYMKLGRSEKVIEIFKDFLDKYPNNPVFEENLASIYVKRGEISKAIEIYEEMVETNPKNTTALINLGFMSAKTGNIAKAKDSFERAYLIDPKNVNVHNGLGLVYLTTGQKDKAREEFNQSLMVEPNNQYAKDMLGRIK